MGATISKKKKVSSYQRLKEKKAVLELAIEAIIERPQSSQAKNFRIQYKIENDLI